MLKCRAIILLLVLLAPPAAFAAPGFVRTGSMASARYQASAVALADGSVLVISDYSVERYDPIGGTFRPAGSLASGHGGGLSATLLDDGTVLIAGGGYGSGTTSAEIYDPATESSTPTTGSLSTPRMSHTATRLLDGRVLIAGGSQYGHPYSSLDSAEIYDPGSQMFTPIPGSMGGRRQNHTATLLTDGRVLIVGGYDDTQLGLTTVVLFSPDTESFAATGGLAAGRGDHTANRLPDGTIVVIGGHSGFPGSSLASAEIYDPATGLFASTGSMASPRGAHTVTALTDGTLLIAGGFTDFPCGGTTLASAEIYAPSTGGFAPTASMHDVRGRHSAAALPGGEVLVMGGLGQYCSGPLASAEVFSPNVVDTHPPVITVPADMTLLASGPEGAIVSYTASAVDDVDAAPAFACVPASGSTFPPGTTTVVCTATDAASNTATASFTITVVPALDNAVTIDSKAGLHPTTGLATLSGRVLCSRPMNGYLSGSLSQAVDSTLLQGSFSRSFRCVPPSFAWVASMSPSGGGGFQPGMADATVTIFGCDTLGSCDSDTAVRTVRLEYRQPPPSLVTITRIVDNQTPMPRAGVNFAYFTLPFVRKGVVAFLAYTDPEHQGVYTGSGGPIKVVADSRTSIPGRPGRFAYFDSLTFDGDTVAFQGRDALYAAGLYTYRGGRLARVADENTPVPGGGGGPFREFVGPVLSAGRVAFRGSTDYSTFFSFGVYTGDRQGLDLVADRLTPIPGGTGQFNYFLGPVAIDGDKVVFPAGSNDQSGLYSSRDGVLSKLADRTTPAPGSPGNFLEFGLPVADQGAVAFTAIDDSFKSGLYFRTRAGTLKKVVDARTAVPSSSTTFAYFSDAALENGVVAFNALDANSRPAGVFTWSAGQLTAVADPGKPAPGGQGNFIDFGAPALAAGNLAFQGADSAGTYGLYAYAYGALRKVISGNDSLDGKAVQGVELVTRSACYYDCHGGFGTGFDGTSVAFLAGFADGTRGIYLATVGRPFADFSASVSLGHDDVELDASFRLGPGNDGIDPVHEAVVVQVGTFGARIPAGSFRSDGDGRFRFDGTIDGVELRVTLRPRSGGRYDFALSAEDVDLTGARDPVTVNLSIGNDAGATSVRTTH